ncbi:Exoglucanase 1 like protein [Verticillium longisporum]|nr:Exoglucanase 1 like protein [Verticillium longisporum]
MKFLATASAAFSLVSQCHSAILWDGRFNDLTSSTDLNKWSWATQVGPYQYYIHGSGPVTEYVNLSPSYKNPADSGSKQGVKISLTDTAYWNGQNMRRTELIPQTSAAINKGKAFCHFSIKRSDVNPPATTREHQIAFFESHFTELKAGWLSGAAGTSDPLLRWCVGGQTHWSVNWDADVWHNVAYEIDFSAGTVGFWHSTGASPLTRVNAPIAASTSSNGADWHLGVLELPRSGYPDAPEDIYFSGVYIEDGTITTSVAGPGSSSPEPPVSPVSSVRSSTFSVASTRSTAPVTAPTTLRTSSTTSRPAPTPVTTAAPPPPVAGAGQWQQCGGNGHTGPTACVVPYTCSTINPWYAQCL